MRGLYFLAAALLTALLVWLAVETRRGVAEKAAPRKALRAAPSGAIIPRGVLIVQDAMDGRYRAVLVGR